MAIDARDNLGAEMMMARNLGGDIGTTIGNYQKFKYNQRIEQETQAGIVMISQRKAADPDYSDDDALRDIDGLPARVREIVRQEYEAREKAKLDREYQKARIKYLSEGGASGAAGDDMTRWKDLELKRKSLDERLDLASGEEEEKLIKLMERIAAEQDALVQRYLPSPESLRTREPAQTPFRADVDAVTMAAPVTGTGQAATPSTPTPPGMQQIETPARTPNLAKAGPGTFGGFGAGSMGVPPSPAITPQQTKADAAIAKEIAPDTQLAPSTQAEPQSGQYIKTAVNPETGQRMGFNGKEWVLIQ